MEAIKPQLEQEAIKAQVRQYIAANFLMGANAAELGDDDSFMGQNVIDSAGVLELIAYLEQTYGIKVDEDEMTADNLDSLNGVGRYLQRKLGGARA
ncbi:MAG TPA: acyl carrier protein [Burkholderiales bacterium]|nr:acyl carrier protein [Burkholderiales bacterium]